MAGTRTIGIVFPGDARARGTWSGTPAGIAGGLEALGFAVRRLDARPSPLANRLSFNLVAAAHTRPGRDPVAAVRRGRQVARVSPTVARARTAGLARRLAATPPLDALVQIGTGYEIPPGPLVATFEDMTIAQAVALDYPGWDGLSARAVAARKAIARRAYERATACCLSTSWAAESVVRDHGIDAAKVHSVGLGRNHHPLPADRDWSAPRFLFVGLDWLGKNGPGVLAAFAAVRAQRPDATLDVVGGHPPLDAPGVTGHGVLRMDVPEDKARLEHLFQTATCFVMPSHREASAIAYIEAMTAGLPVIGSAAGGSIDLIGDAGEVVDPADGAALLSAMRRYADPGTARALSAIAVERSELFTWRAVAERIVRALGLEPEGAGELAAFLEPAAVR
jgi:glycosyltransferase involved in cell wall biosynthesis